MATSPLHRYWMTLAVPGQARRQFGVTALDSDDDLRLVADYLGIDGAMDVAEIIEDVDLGSFDAKHVLTNSGPTVFRGVWYPSQASLESSDQLLSRQRDCPSDSRHRLLAWDS